jgi:hypothetical protein
MVLDLRFLDSPQSGGEEKSESFPEVDEASAADAADLELLLEQAAAGPSPVSRAAALASLRQLVPSSEGVQRLWQIATDRDDKRRLASVQMLGFHRDWLVGGRLVRRLAAWIPDETETAVARAMVWCLRQHEASAPFLLHGDSGVTREAALGVPIERRTLKMVVEALRLGQDTEVERILLERLGGVHTNLVGPLVEYLLEAEWPEGGTRLELVVERLSQIPLFECSIDQRRQTVWDPQQGVVEDPQLRRSRRLEAAVLRVLKRSPGVEFLRYLLNRSGEDEAFARRHAVFLKATLGNADALFGTELLHHVERLTVRATGDKVERLAQMLVQLKNNLEGSSQAKASALLEDWKNRFPHLKLKLFHLQQGWS